MAELVQGPSAAAAAAAAAPVAGMKAEGFADALHRVRQVRAAAEKVVEPTAGPVRGSGARRGARPGMRWG